MYDFTRRASFGIGAAIALGGRAGAQAPASAIPRADVTAPRLPIENGASLRVIRPARFVEPDEVIFRQNTARFTEKTGVAVRVDFVGWEDIRPQTAVVANTGTGPDIVIGWSDDPHIYADKVIEVSDIAEYLGARYGGWTFLGEMYGKKRNSRTWLGLPFGGGIGPVTYRVSAVRAAGFESIPEDHAGFLRLCQALKRNNRPVGFALGNAVGDGNAFAQWLLWSHGAKLVDDDGKVVINSPETIAALNYLKEFYQTFTPGTLAWLDPSNNRAYASQEIFLTSNGVSLYFALKNDAGTRPIADDTEHAPMPKGLAAASPHTSTVLNAMLFRHTRFPNAAKAYLTFMMESEQYDPWLTGCIGYWGQSLNAYRQSAVWNSDPKIKVFADAMNTRFWSGYSGPITQASGTVAAEYVLVQMCAAVAAGQSTPQEAAREAERRARRAYRA